MYVPAEVLPVFTHIDQRHVHVGITQHGLHFTGQQLGHGAVRKTGDAFVVFTLLMLGQSLAFGEDAMLAFFDFPAEHWGHLRTSNPIESVFATVRHRTVRTKGALSQKTAKLMVFTLIQAASKKWLRLKGRNQLPKVIEGIKFNDGVEVTDATENRAA